MTLRKKMPFIIGIMCVVFIGGMYWVSSGILLEDFTDLEDQSMRRDVRRTMDAVSETLNNLSILAGDYSRWDDTYQFMEDRNDEYIKSNLVESTLIQQKLNLIVYVDISGNVVFSKAVDWRNERPLPIPDDLKSHLGPDSLLVKHVGSESEMKGLLTLSGGIMLVASQPILTSEDEGPIRGAVIFGRYLDDKEVERLGEITHLDVSVMPFGAADMPPDFELAKKALIRESSSVLPLNEETIAGFAQLEDMAGNPCLLLKIESPRTIYRQGLASHRNLMFSLLALGLLFGGATAWLLEKYVLSPLARLGREINVIRERKDVSTRVSEGRKDELGKLARSINEMLLSLEYAHHELLDSEERYRAVIEQVSEAIFLFDPETLKIMEANRASQTLLGYGPEDMRTLRVYDLIELPAEQIEAAVKSVRQTRSSFNNELPYRRRDGMVRDAEICLSVVRLTGREVFCVIARDITEQKQAREVLRRSRDDLEVRVQERTVALAQANTLLQAEIEERRETERQLRKAKEAAETATRAKSEFLANISHELRTPMNGVIGMTELALGTELNGEQREYLELVKKTADSLMMTVSDILDFSRVDAGEIELETAEFGLKRCAEGVFERFASRARCKGLELSCQIGPKVPDGLIGDSARLQQLLTCLMDNAIKFTEAGYIRVHVDRIPGDDEGVGLHFAVEDSGIGIPLKKQKEIFEPFSQADNSHTRKYGGTGLGLTLAARLAGLMGGKLWVESPLPQPTYMGGSGSIFHFTARFGVLEDERAITSHRPLHILLGEDNLINQKMTARLLEKRGYTITAVQNGEEILSLLEMKAIDLVLVDSNVLEACDRETIRKFRTPEKDVPVVVLTSTTASSEAERFFDGVFDVCLKKPFEPEELFRAIETVILDVAVG
jgi:PAS domain S-box-containing protein